MGRIICPNGMSVKSRKVKGSIPYAWIVRDIQSEKFTHKHRTKLINVIVDVGVFDKDFVSYMEKTVHESHDNEFKNAATKVLEIFYRKGE